MKNATSLRRLLSPLPLLLLLFLCHANWTHAAPKLCPPGNCNAAGACTSINDQVKCRCIGNYYTGVRCTELVDHCASSPCKNGGTCTPVMGQYICTNCRAGFVGQQCFVRKPETFTKLLVLFNPTVVYGERLNFIMTMESVGSLTFVFEAFTSNCLLGTFEVVPRAGLPKVLQQSNDLPAVARSLGITHAAQLPYRRGYYYEFYDNFWDAGDIEITARVSDSESAALYEHTFHVHVIQPSSVPCVPDIGVKHGGNPLEPILVDIARFNIFDAVVHSHCAPDSTILMEWTIHNSIGNVLLHNFGKTGKTQLKVHPYRLWFNFHGELVQSYMLRVNADEHFDGRTVHKKVRCYIFVMSKPVSAIILGGDERDFGVGQPFMLDGSHSRDFALAPSVDQEMKFKWHCTSDDDVSNRFCRANIGKSNRLSVPANALKLGKSYRFTFTVNSFVTLSAVDSTTQSVRIVTAWQHDVAIECVRNCLSAKFTLDRKVHLRMRCSSCSSSAASTTIAWSANGASVGAKYRVGFDPPNAASLTVEVAVTSAGKSGKAKWTLTKNEPPAGGSCTINPASGVEYETDFLVECKSYVDTDSPLSYQFNADEFTFDRTNERLMHTRLPVTSQIKVIICDFLYACTETPVAVSVQAMTAPPDAAAMRTFLQADANNMAKLLTDGNIQRVMVLADVLTRNTRTLEIGNLILKQFANFEIYTLIQVEQLAKITRNLIQPLQPIDNEKVTLFTAFFKKINAGFRNVISDSELWELQRGPYEVLSTEVVNMISEFSSNLENIPPVEKMETLPVNSADPLAEKYPPIPDFDETVLERIEHWLHAIAESFECMQYVGVAGTTIHEPSDEHYKLSSAGAQMDVFSIEGTKPVSVRSTNNEVEVTLPKNMLAELQTELQSPKVLLQVITFEKNPFWWFPIQNKLNTDIVSFSAFSEAVPLHGSTALESPFEFRLQRVATSGGSSSSASGSSRSSRSVSADTRLIRGFVNHTRHLRIYKIHVPINSVLVVRFSDATARLHIKLQLCKRPSTVQMLESEDIVPEQDTLTITNHLLGFALAFVGVLPAEDISASETFQFETSLLKCVSWNFKSKDPHWTTEHCWPKLNLSDSEQIVCRCFHLSVFAGQSHGTVAELLNLEPPLGDYLPPNYYMIAGFLLLILGFAALFLCAYYGMYHHKGNLLTALQAEDYQRDFDVVVHITTGSQWYATTSANITLTFALTKGVRKFTIYQNPEEPHLVRNSTCSIWLPLSGDDLKQPLLMTVRRDNSGRYPSWYCRTIVVEDFANELICTFEVKQWIPTEPFVLDASLFQEDAPPKMTAFKESLSAHFVQSFQNQPLLGAWKYGDLALNRFERTCLWAVKLAISICVVSCYMGRTTLENYEEERDLYRNIVFDGFTIFFLCVLSYLIGFAAETALKVFIYHDEVNWQSKRGYKEN